MNDNFDGTGVSSSGGELLGVVVGGSLGQGLEIRLGNTSGMSVEDVKVGSFVTVRGKRNRFFGVVTDISLGGSDARLKHAPTGVEDPFIADVLSGTIAYGNISVLPTLTMPVVSGDNMDPPVAAKTIPGHFSPVYTASEQDVAMVFGEEDDQHFWIGTP
ncbi:uncharacterized protein METZ01_LOCUS506655, partial [marine metagenome]